MCLSLQRKRRQRGLREKNAWRRTSAPWGGPRSKCRASGVKSLQHRLPYVRPCWRKADMAMAPATEALRDSARPAPGMDAMA